jgi:hypothetical protein
MLSERLIDMTKKEALSIAGTLSEPSKMPSHSYGIPAEECITGSKLVDVANSICANCYALKGFYKLYGKTIKPSQYKRFESIENPLWTEAMVTLIASTKNKWFRWHDSGDLQSVEHLAKIVDVAKRLPDVLFWLPTREYAIVRDWTSQNGAFPDNLVVRLSAHMKGQTTDHLEAYGLPTSRVYTTDTFDGIGTECVARYQQNACGDCRKCWDKSVQTIAYHEH